MQDLVLAFEIFAKYTNYKYPLGCENVDKESGWLYVYVDPASVSVEDNDMLHELGFWVNGDDNKYTMWVGRKGDNMNRFYRVYDDSEILIYEGEDWNEASDAMQFKGGAVLYSTDSNPKPPMDVLDGDKDTRIINLSTLLNILDPEDVPLLTQMGKETRGASSVKEFLNTLVEGDVEWQEYKLVEGGKKSSPFPPKKED